MPTYPYHLKLELYPQPTNDTFTSDSRVRTVFVPPAESDIFTTPLPAHRSTPWTLDFTHKRAKPSFDSAPPSRVLSPETRPSSAGHLETPGDALLLPERNPALKDKQAHVPTSPKPSPKHASKDWRFGPVSIDSIDMESQDKSNGAKGSGALHTRATYVPSESKTTEVGWGVVHLYKDSQELPDLSTPRKSLSDDSEGTFDIDKCSTLCILAVPSWMMPSDLLGFVGDQTREDVSHFRLIRTGRANKYMVLMKFRFPKKARDWQRAWNGRLFSAMAPENCHVVFISTVTFLTPTASFPHNTTDPFTTPSTLFPKPLPPPTSSLTELPTCPVCLERMDSTTGLLTILCQHVFHCACLEKWRGSGCPVCRFSQSPSSTFPFPRPSSAALDGIDRADSPTCSVCAATANLWICLVCGNVGCGRYDDAHAFAHWEATSHCYAMDVASQHVWDYAGDGYVHRLIQNKDTVVLSAGGGGGGGALTRSGGGGGPRHPNMAFRSEAQAGDSVPREKMESMANEYTFLLTGQLESQRRYFEEQVQRAVDKASAAAGRAEEAGRRLEEVLGKVEGARADKEGAEAELKALTAQMDRLKTKADRLDGLARSSMLQAREEKTINEGLMVRIAGLEKQVGEKNGVEAKLKVEIEELKELNRDLTMFVEGREQLRKMEEEEGLEKGEVEGGQVVVGEKKGRKGKGRKK